MFEELGYKRDEFINANSDYINKKFVSYGNGKVHITFSNFLEKPSVCKFKETIFKTGRALNITFQELQAINKQVEELGWR